MYLYCANSTCVLAFAVCALMAKMSRIRLVLSRIFTLSSCSIFLICFAESSSSKITIPTGWYGTGSGSSPSFVNSVSGKYTSPRSALSSQSSIYALISSSFPLPTYVTLDGPFTLCVNLFTVTAPAVSARNSSSSRYSFVFASPCCGVINPTSTAHSVFVSDITNSFISRCTAFFFSIIISLADNAQ